MGMGQILYLPWGNLHSPAMARCPGEDLKPPRAIACSRSSWSPPCRIWWTAMLGDLPVVDFLRNSILVGGLEHDFFFQILGMSSSQLTNSIIFQRGRLKPPTRIDSIESMQSMGYTWVIRQKNLRYHLVAFFLRSEKKKHRGIRRSSEASGDPTNHNMKWGYG